jgi:hypothetical protein
MATRSPERKTRHIPFPGQLFINLTQPYAYENRPLQTPTIDAAFAQIAAQGADALFVGGLAIFHEPARPHCRVGDAVPLAGGL